MKLEEAIKIKHKDISCNTMQVYNDAFCMRTICEKCEFFTKESETLDADRIMLTIVEEWIK
jgi:hypothetical protein